MVSTPQLNDWLVAQFDMFHANNPSTDYQRGYLASLIEVSKVFGVAKAAREAVEDLTYQEYDNSDEGEKDV